MRHPPTDRRLAAVSRSDGTIDPSKVQDLFNRDPSTLTIPQVEAMHVIVYEAEFWEDNPLAGVSYASKWLDAFIEVTGGTITREKVRHGEVVQRTVRRYRGRADVRRHRGEIHSNTGPRATARESHRSRPGHRRSASSSSTSSSDPGDSEPAEPAGPAVAPASLEIAEAAWMPCPLCGQPLHERDGAHCGGCGITWWEGVR